MEMRMLVRARTLCFTGSLVCLLDCCQLLNRLLNGAYGGSKFSASLRVRRRIELNGRQCC